MKKIQNVIEYFKNIDPCGEESTCLVKAACHMRQEKPWIRTQKCPDYIKYTKRRDKFIEIKNDTIDWFWTITMISCFLFICFIFILGIMKFIELIKWW
jgi:hypothetical protein